MAEIVPTVLCENAEDYKLTIERLSRRVFPGNLVAGWAGLEARANFSVENEAQISTAPKVNFGS